MICPSCKKEVNKNLTFCPHCGARLTLSNSNKNRGEIPHIYTMAEDLDIAKGKVASPEKKIESLPARRGGRAAPPSKIEEKSLPPPPPPKKEPEKKILPPKTPITLEPPKPPPPKLEVPKPSPKKEIPAPPIKKPPPKTISLPKEKTTFKKRYPSLLKIIILILIVAAVGIVSFLFYQYHSKVKLSPPKLLPNDTTLLIEFDLRALKRGGDFAELSAKVSTNVLTTSTWPQIFTGVLEPGFKLPVSKLGKKAAFAIVRVNREGTEKEWVSLIELKNENTAQETLSQFKEISSLDKRIKISPNNIAFSQTKNFLIISKKEEIVKKILEVKAGSELPLAKNDNFKKALKEVEGNKLISFFKDNPLISQKQKIGYYFLVPSRLSGLIEKKSLTLPWVDTNALTEAGKLMATKKGLEITGKRLVLPHKKKLEKINKLGLTTLVPKNATFYFEGKNLPLILESFQEKEKIPFLTNITSKFSENGINLEKEAKDFLDQEFAIFFTPHPKTSKQNLSMIFRIKDINQAKEKMRELEEKLLLILPELLKSEAASVTFNDNRFQEVDIRYINFPEPALSFDYAFIDDKLIISNSRESTYFLIESIKNPESGLEFSENFKEASQALGLEKFDYFFFLNPAELLKSRGSLSIFSDLKFENVKGLFGEISFQEEKQLIKSFILIK